MASRNKPSEEEDVSGQPEEEQESFRLAAFWKSQIDAYDQAMRKWVKKANTVVKRYRDERTRVEDSGDRRMNYLWANTQVMLPAIYSTCPIPIVDRKFLDRDPIGRLSSQILERTLKNELEYNNFHESVGRSVLDRLLAGRGVVWCRYVPEFGEGESLPGYTANAIEDPLMDIGADVGDKSLTDETEEEEKLEETNETVIEEKTEVDYIDWRDFYYFPTKARTWSEVQAIGKRVYISRKEAKEFFGKKIGSKLRPDTSPQSTGQNPELDYSKNSAFEQINEKNIMVFEIWNKSDKNVYWVSTGYEYLCKKEEDPLQLTTFFPVPPPLFSTSTNDTLVPVPDYVEWQDQAIQIDELTQRLAMLAKACKVVGAYDAKNTALKRIFDEGCENELIPVDQWAMYAEMGGIEGMVSFVPLEQIQKCIETLQKVRQQVQIDLDQVTGLSDVIRGTSDSRETLGGLRLKNNNAGTRLSRSQAEVARFARDTLRIIAEISSKHFSDETLIESSGILYEDALQPDTIMREWQAENGMGPQPQQQGLPGAQQGGPPGGGQAPGVPMPPHSQMPMPGAPMPGMLANPMARLSVPMPPQNNVVPFPGAQHPQPNLPMPAPMGGAPMGMLPPMPPQPPDPQLIIADKINKALKLLREDVRRGYRIDIETDSTIFGDKYQERQDATEFTAALGTFIKQFGESAMAEPQLMPLMGKTLQWAVRKYRVGRDLESEIDNFVIQMTKKAKDLENNPKPSPEEQKAQASIKIEQQKAQAQAVNDQRDAERQQKDDERQFQMEQAKDQREKDKMNLEAQLEKMKAEMEMQMMQMKMQLEREKHGMELQKLQVGAQVEQHKANTEIQANQMEMHQKSQEHAQNIQMQHEEHQLQQHQHQQKMEQTDAAHKQKMQQAKQKPKKKAS